MCRVTTLDKIRNEGIRDNYIGVNLKDSGKDFEMDLACAEKSLRLLGKEGEWDRSARDEEERNTEKDMVRQYKGIPQGEGSIGVGSVWDHSSVT